MRGFLAVIAVGLVGLYLLLAYGVQSTSTYRYRLQVELDTPQGRKTASSVIEVLVRKVEWGTPESKGTKIEIVAGEALYFDMGGGRNLVAAMTSGADGQENYDFTRIAELSVQAATGKYPDLAKMGEQRGTLTVPETAWPTLVRFANVSDAFSCRVVAPADLAQEFGTGTRLRAVTVTFTDDRPGGDIEKKLPFLKRQADQLQRLYSYAGKFSPQPYYFVIN